jgi:hypothetical protein
MGRLCCVKRRTGSATDASARVRVGTLSRESEPTSRGAIRFFIVQSHATESEEAILPFGAPLERIRRATQLRSTLVVASLQSLREHGHYERYDGLLQERREEILSCVGGGWLPMAVARVHYQTCDALGLTLRQQFEMGHSVGDRARKSWFASALKVARGVGVTPWSLAPYLNKLHQRTIDAGGVAAFRLGPKEARVVYVGNELLDIPYFREASRGLLHAVAEMFCETMYSRELPGRRSGEATFRLQWA